MRWSVLAGGALLAAASLLSACAGNGGAVENRVRMTPISFNEIPGWNDDRQGEALGAFKRSCPRLTSSPDSKIVTDGGEKTITAAEWKTICDAAAGIKGVREGTSNPVKPLPADIRAYPDAIAQAISQLRLVGVNGPYSVLLSADVYTGLSETSDHGYPVMEHIKRLVDGKIIWAPAISGAYVLTTRGGDFALHLGQDVSIGYLSHDDKTVRLYLQETFTFLMLTTEAAVVLTLSER